MAVLKLCQSSLLAKNWQRLPHKMLLIILERFTMSEIGSTLLDWLSVLGFFALQASIATGSLQSYF